MSTPDNHSDRLAVATAVLVMASVAAASMFAAHHLRRRADDLQSQLSAVTADRNWWKAKAELLLELPPRGGSPEPIAAPKPLP